MAYDVAEALEKLEAFRGAHLERADIEYLLGVKRRRAQYILKTCATGRVGQSLIASVERVRSWLQDPVMGENSRFEMERRARFADWLDRVRADRLKHPQCLVEAPIEITDQTFEKLPDGILLEPGHISVWFEGSTQAKEKLLALAMAMGRDGARFDELVS